MMILVNILRIPANAIVLQRLYINHTIPYHTVPCQPQCTMAHMYTVGNMVFKASVCLHKYSNLTNPPTHLSHIEKFAFYMCIFLVGNHGIRTPQCHVIAPKYTKYQTIHHKALWAVSYIHHVMPLKDRNCRLTLPVAKGRCARGVLPHTFNIDVFKSSKPILPQQNIFTTNLQI